MKKLLILGGAYSQVPAICRASELGYYVITCDYNPLNPGHKYANKYINISSTDYKNVLRMVEKEKIRGVIAYASDPAAETAAYISDALHLPGASFESTRTLSEKNLFRDFQRKNGFVVPDYCTFVLNDNLEDKIKNIVYPCIVKPVDCSGSKGVVKVDNKDSIIPAINNAIKTSRKGVAIAEAYIESELLQIHGDGIVFDGKLVFAALGDQRFINSAPIGSSYPSRASSKKLNMVLQEVQHVIDKTYFSEGGINIEARIDRKGRVFIVEIGARCGGNYIPQWVEASTGIDEMTILLQMACGDWHGLSNLDRKEENYVFQYIIGADKNGVFDRIEVAEDISSKVKYLFVHKTKGDKVEYYSNSSCVIGVAIIQFKTLDEMEYNISHIKEKIKVVLKGV